MKDKQETINKILYPKKWLFVLVVIIGFSSVIATLILNLNETAFGYISYVLSFYALVITVAKIPNIFKICYEKLDNMKYSNKYIHDLEFREHIGLWCGFIFNLLYVVFKVVTGIMYKSIWLVAIAGYYLVLTIIRYILLKNIRKNISYENKLRVFRLTGILMFILNIAMMGMIYQMVTQNMTFVYPGHIIYAMALYTFYIFIVAIINLVKYKKLNDPLLSSIKIICLATACMAIFSIQTALISAFGNDEGQRLMLNSITGSVVLVAVVGMAVFMIVSASIKLKNLKNEINNQEEV